MTMPSSRSGDGSRAARAGMAMRPGDVRIERARDARGTLRRLARYFSPFRVAMIATLGMVLVYTAAGLAGPYLMGVAIDRYIAAKAVDGLGAIALLMLAAFGVNNGVQLVASWVMAGVSQQALRRMRKDLFQHLQSLPQSYFDTHPAGDLMSRLTSDIDALNQAVSQNITSLIAGVLSLRYTWPLLTGENKRKSELAAALLALDRASANRGKLEDELRKKVEEIRELNGDKFAADFEAAFRKKHRMDPPKQLESGIKGYLPAPKRD